MRIQLWGTRGSIPSPLKAADIEGKVIKALELYQQAGSPRDVDAFCQRLPFAVRSTYGGDTCCVQVDAGSDELLVFDAGSGLRHLGFEIMAQQQGPRTIHIFLSHFHWDHIQGFPFFVPAYIPGNVIHFYAVHEGLQQNLAGQQNSMNFPVDMEYMNAEFHFHQINVGDDIEVANCRVETFAHIHPGESYGFIARHQDKKAIYSTDCEYIDMPAEKFTSFLQLFADADLLIFDAQYTLEETVDSKYQWGHSTFSVGLDLAKSARIKRLALFHHDPTSTDFRLEELRTAAENYRDLVFGSPDACQVIWSRDGLTIEV